ncbi:MAG: DNA primase [Candidatus Magasanikbacteria bacterium]|nr:DNA primase [Candidatus Magasanikbacteria bacterium]
MSDTQQIKDKLDVVDLIGEYIQLKPAGSNHKGLCPFHNEKSPSFMVNRERASWHCFGCAKGGDIFTFVEEMEGMEFREALKYLAQKAGVTLTSTFQQEVSGNQKNRIKDINLATARFFHNFLLQIQASKSAREYLQHRGLTDDTISTWQVGFIPDQWDLLTKYLFKKGFSIDDLIASGLTIKRDGADTQSMRGFYDRFRGRIMFPIWDVHDAVVGFTGRVLVETEHSGGKYVNTPQTSVYDKSRVIFGLNKAKREIKTKDQTVMVEGQMDVIACHQAGMTNVVATSGTALTEHQIKLLTRYSKNICMAFDADDAGIAAARRGIALALQAGMNVRVIQIPDGAGKDPDEVLKKNKQIWFDAVEHATDVMQWYFDRAFLNRDITDPKDKQSIANELLQEIKNIPYAVEQDHWMQELSGRLRTSIEVLRENLKQLRQEQKDLKIGKKPLENQVTQIITLKKTRLDALTERILSIIVKFPILASVDAFFISSQALSTGIVSDLYEMLKKQYTQNKVVDIDAIRAFCATSENSENGIDVLLMEAEKDFANLKEEDTRKELTTLITLSKEAYIKQERTRLQELVKEAEKVGDNNQLMSLLLQLKKLA